eukprot:612327-Amphidinium_carterae.4
MQRLERLASTVIALRENGFAVMALGQADALHPLYTIPYPREHSWLEAHTAAITMAAEILVRVAGRAFVSVRERRGICYYDGGPFSPSSRVYFWTMSVDVRQREVFLYMLTRGARALRLSMLQFDLRRRRLQRGVVSYTSDLATGWMSRAVGVHAIIMAPTRDDMLVLFNEGCPFPAIRGGQHDPSSCWEVYLGLAVTQRLRLEIERMHGMSSIWSPAQQVPCPWCVPAHSDPSLVPLYCPCCMTALCALMTLCDIALFGPSSYLPCSCRGGMIDIDADYDVEEVVASKSEEELLASKPEIVGDGVRPPVDVADVPVDAPAGAAPTHPDEGEAARTPAALNMQNIAPGQTEPVVKTETNSPSAPPQAVREADQYNPERRAVVLSGRLHLGMEIDDSGVLPRGSTTAEYTVRWGEEVGNARKAAEYLWSELKPFRSFSGLLWHGCWHLDFLPKDQAPTEQYNLTYALWQQQFDWDQVAAAILHCRQEFRRVLDILDAPWQDLKQFLPKTNKVKQRRAWDALLKASALPTREDYERREAERLK